MARQANIIAKDEFDFTWVIAEGDPGWAAASYAKKSLLLDKPILPRFLLRTGWPDREIAGFEELIAADFEAVTAAPNVKIIRKVWNQTKRAFQASKTQRAAFGGRVPSA